MKKPYITIKQFAQIAKAFLTIQRSLIPHESHKSRVETFMTWTGKDMVTEFVAKNTSRTGQLDPSLDYQSVLEEVEEALREMTSRA
jgi:hypothetical protein